MNKVIISLLVLFLGSNSFFAQNDKAQPPNSSYLSEYGLSVKLFNTMANPMYQEETVFSGDLNYHIVEGSSTQEYSFGFYYDPFYEYGLSLQVIIDDPSVYDLMSKKSIAKRLSKDHEKFKKMKGENVLNEDDVYLIRDNGREVVLGFQFDKEKLPGAYKYLASWGGQAFMEDGVLHRIELSLVEPDRVNGVDLQEGKYTGFFTKLKSGGYLLTKMLDYKKGSKKGVPVEITETIDVTEYPDIDTDEIASHDFNLEEKNRTAATDTIKVKMERSLPFLGNAARKAGYELPLPFGVDVFTHFQEETLGLEEVAVNGIDLTEGLKDGRSSANTTTNLVAVKGDVWVLPFLNFTLIGGYITGKTDVSLVLTEEMKELLGLESDQLNFSTTVTGPMMGAGVILAGGYKNLFATVNAMYISQYVNEANVDVNALAVTPMIGWRFPKLINIMAGAQYQIYDSNISGSIALEGESLDYDVTLRANEWNFLVGLQRDFSSHWNGSILLGGQPRPQTTITLGYRF